MSFRVRTRHRRSGYAAPVRRRLIPIAVLLVALLAGGTAGAAVHGIPRGLSLHYRDGAFTGRIKSDASQCLVGVVALHKLKKGSDPIVGSARAGAGGRFSIPKRARSGRYYVDTGAYTTEVGLCVAVRSRIVERG